MPINYWENPTPTYLMPSYPWHIEIPPIKLGTLSFSVSPRYLVIILPPMLNPMMTIFVSGCLSQKWRSMSWKSVVPPTKTKKLITTYKILTDNIQKYLHTKYDSLQSTFFINQIVDWLIGENILMISSNIFEVLIIIISIPIENLRTLLVINNTIRSCLKNFIMTLECKVRFTL